MINQKLFRRIGAAWGVGGVALLLGFAVYRLLPVAAEIFTAPLSGWQIVILVLWCGFMFYTEGYRAFHKQFAPRVVSRANYLMNHGNWLQVILAPLFCAGYFNASKRRIVVVCGLAVGIIILIIAVHFIPQPWRGVIDAGVVLGLVSGIIYIGLHAVRAVRTPKGMVDPEVVLPQSRHKP